MGHIIWLISNSASQYMLFKPQFKVFSPYMMFSSIHVGFFHYSHYTLFDDRTDLNSNDLFII